MILLIILIVGAIIAIFLVDNKEKENADMTMRITFGIILLIALYEGISFLVKKLIIAVCLM